MDDKQFNLLMESVDNQMKLMDKVDEIEKILQKDRYLRIYDVKNMIKECEEIINENVIIINTMRENLYDYGNGYFENQYDILKGEIDQLNKLKDLVGLVE